MQECKLLIAPRNNTYKLQNNLLWVYIHPDDYMGVFTGILNGRQLLPFRPRLEQAPGS